MEYAEFIKSKALSVTQTGWEVSEKDLHSHCFPFQKFIVRNALRNGKYAIWADCGLGKTVMQLEWGFQVRCQTQMPVLIVAPLAVVGQTIEEGKKFGIEVLKYSGIVSQSPTMYITNYEQLENIDVSVFGGVILDESSILKNFEGKTKNLVIDLFRNTPYKLTCTATPSPNDPMELGNHSEFLDVMSRNEMLAMYFVHDGGETSKWRLKGHCEQLFWDLVSTWAIMLRKPSDIGFSDEGYILPGLNLIEKEVKTPVRENGQLFNEVVISATNFNAELRFTKVERLSEIEKIVNGSNESFLVAVNQNEEADYLRKVIPGAVEVRGSDDPEYKAEKLLAFAKDKFRVLLTKAKIVQYGLNYQNCHNIAVASPDFSFEKLYQLIRRCLRFGQKNIVNVYVISTDTMQNVIESYRRKESGFNKMQDSMTIAINKNLTSKKMIKLKREYKLIEGGNYAIELGDCVELIEKVPDESIGFSIFSPPFAELYTYSDEIEDMGNSKDYKEFFTAFNFLIKQLFRVVMSGRNVAVHCMDLPIQKSKEGFIGLRDFSGMIREAFESAGFIYHTRVTIWKNPVVEMQRTKALGLLHKQVKKDAAMSRVGIPDYLLVFRKPGESKSPVIHQDKDTHCSTYLPVDLWQKYASPVWMDIDYGKTLNGRSARDDRDEKHIAPLQLETIERAIHLWTNPGDTILTPFMGIGSEVYQAIKMGRKAIGYELKTSYFNVAAKNCANAEDSKSQIAMDMFDLMEQPPSPKRTVEEYKAKQKELEKILNR